MQETSNTTRALPDAMTAALAAALQQADLPSRLPSADHVDGQPAFQVSSLANESQQQLRLLVSEELAQAVQQINSAQVCFKYSCIGSLVFKASSYTTHPNWVLQRSLALTAFLHVLNSLTISHPYVESALQISPHKLHVIPTCCACTQTCATLPVSIKDMTSHPSHHCSTA